MDFYAKFRLFFLHIALNRELLPLSFFHEIPIFKAEGGKNMVGGVSNFNIPTLSYTMGQHGKMSLPVDPSSLIYSNFEHVSGIQAPEGTQGVSISKLNLLDVLVGMASRINKNPAPQTPLNLSPAEGVDTIIENIENQIRQAKAENEAMPYYPSPNAESGLLFNFSL
jgi:hypothetical protein